MRLSWKKSQKTHTKDYCIEIRPDAPGVWAKNLILNFAIIGNWRLGNEQGRHSLEGLRRYEIHTQAYSISHTTGLLVVWRPQYNNSRFVWGSFITDRHPGEGRLLLPISSTGTPLLDLRPEAAYTFALFGISTSDLPPDCCLYWDPCPKTRYPFYAWGGRGSFITDHPQSVSTLYRSG